MAALDSAECFRATLALLRTAAIARYPGPGQGVPFSLARSGLQLRVDGKGWEP